MIHNGHHSIDKRENPRKKLEFELIVNPLNTPNLILGGVQNISLGGIKVKNRNPPSPFEKEQEVRFFLNRDNLVLNGEGKVVWISEMQGEVGIKFTQLAEETRRSLEQFLRQSMLRTLIVDDYISFRQELKRELLFYFPLMEVIEAGSGEEALETLGSHPVDLIFMDIKLPGQSGLEVTKTIKANYPDITVIILTTYTWAECEEAAIRSGASGFVNKNSSEIDKIFTLVGCFERAKLNNSKPNCIRLVGGSE